MEDAGDGPLSVEMGINGHGENTPVRQIAAPRFKTLLCAPEIVQYETHRKRSTGGRMDRYCRHSLIWIEAWKPKSLAD